MIEFYNVYVSQSISYFLPGKRNGQDDNIDLKEKESIENRTVLEMQGTTTTTIIRQ